MIINEKYLKEYSPIPLNYDLSEIRNYIGVAEKIWVVPVLGQDLYDEIQSQVDENKLSDENYTAYRRWSLAVPSICNMP